MNYSGRTRARKSFLITFFVMIFSLSGARISFAQTQYNVNINGLIFTLETATGAPSNPQFGPLLQNQLWFNNQALANSFAAALGSAAGFPNRVGPFIISGPYFNISGINQGYVNNVGWFNNGSATFVSEAQFEASRSKVYAIQALPTGIGGGLTFQSSQVSPNGLVLPNFIGGTLQMSQARGQLPQNFTLDSSALNTIDANGNVTNFTGGFTDASGQAGNIKIISSANTGNQKIIFSGRNTYTGSTIIGDGSNGVYVQAGTFDAFSPFSATLLNSQSFLDVGGFLQAVGSLAGAGTVTNSGSTAASLAVGGNNANTTFAGLLRDGSSQLGLTKIGSGALTLTGNNTYSGPTVVDFGTLKAGAVNAFSSTSPIQIGSSGSLDLDNFNQIIGSLAGTGSTALGSATLTVGGNNNSTNYMGVMTGTGSLIKVGTGAMTVGTLAYTGDTNINAGTLILSNGSSIASTINVANTATFINSGIANGAVTNNGSVTNFGSIQNTVANNGILNINGSAGSITGAISGIGTININNGSFTQQAAITNGAININNGGVFVSTTNVATNSGLNINQGGTVNNTTGTISSSVSNSGTLTNAAGGVISGSLTNNSGGLATNAGSVTNTVSNSGTFTNSNGGVLAGFVTNSGTLTNAAGGTISGALTNNNGGVATNAGSVTNTVSNSGTFTNSAGGAVTGAVVNSGSATNFGMLSSTLANSGTFVNSGLVNQTITNSGTFANNGNAASSVINSGVAINNSGGIISGSVINDKDRSRFTNKGRIDGEVLNSVASAFFDHTGVINGAITNAGIFFNRGLINNNVANSGVFYVDGQRTVTGNLTNSGDVSPLTADDRLTVTGAYSQTASGRFVTPIASTTRFGKLISSSQPLNIADGSKILALMDPRLRIGPGTIFAGVVQGAGTPVETQIDVRTDRPRYKLKAVWSGPNVDLVYFGTYLGALVDQTLYSLSTIQGPTLNALHQRYAMLNAVMEYDCNRFEKNNFCISAQARATGFGSQATGAGVFNIAYRPTEQTRVGVYLDYQVLAGSPATQLPSVIGAFSAGSVNYGYDNATFGGYAGYSQSGYSGRVLNTGVQALVSGGYNPGKVQTTRALMLDPYLFDFVDSQPGSGSAALNAWFTRGMLGYGHKVTDTATIMPYVGLRYTDVTRGGYMEDFNAVVTQPLVYNPYYERLVTGFGGLMLEGKATDKLGLLAGVGAELDFSRAATSFSGYSPLALQDAPFLFGFRHGGSWNGFRPTGTLGAYYDLMPNHRISLNGYAGQQAWSSRAFTSGLLGYQVAF